MNKTTSAAISGLYLERNQTLNEDPSVSVLELKSSGEMIQVALKRKMCYCSVGKFLFTGQKKKESCDEILTGNRTTDVYLCM